MTSQKSSQLCTLENGYTSVVWLWHEIMFAFMQDDFDRDWVVYRKGKQNNQNFMSCVIVYNRIRKAYERIIIILYVFLSLLVFSVSLLLTENAIKTSYLWHLVVNNVNSILVVFFRIGHIISFFFVLVFIHWNFSLHDIIRKIWNVMYVSINWLHFTVKERVEANVMLPPLPNQVCKNIVTCTLYLKKKCVKLFSLIFRNTWWE